MTPEELRAKVDTIVIVTMENRSFDHVLGHLRAARFADPMPDVDGVIDVRNPDYVNFSEDAVAVPPFWTGDVHFPTDLPHGKQDIVTQLAESPLNHTYQMNGFVKAYEQKYKVAVGRSAPMGLLDPSGAPVTSELARRYTVCDRWFASLPSYTAPNRLMALSGYYDSHHLGPFLPDQDTIYEWLSARGVKWRVYAAGIPFVTLMAKFTGRTLGPNFRRLDRLAADLAEEPPEQRPHVIFVEPEYFDSPIHLGTPCDNHPPLAMAAGEAFVARVYNTLSAHEDVWSKLVMILSYDEHGGFWDHVSPPKIPYQGYGAAFASLGPRLPAVLIGPYAGREACHLTLDNTAILQFLTDRFGRPGEFYSDRVRQRMYAGIARLADALHADVVNKVHTLPKSAPVAPAQPGPNPNSELHAGFTAALDVLRQQHRDDVRRKYPELA